MSTSEQVRILMSPEIGEFAKAMAKAQAKMGRAKKDSLNPFFKSKFTSLASIDDACREELSANEIATVQSTDIVGDGTVMVTNLIHGSGQWMRGYMPIVVAKQGDPQAFGSALHYARRYSLAAMVGVCPADDDAEAAMADSRKPQVATLRPEQVLEIEKLVKNRSDLKAKLLDWAGVKIIADIPASKYDSAMRAIEMHLTKEGAA